MNQRLIAVAMPTLLVWTINAASITPSGNLVPSGS
jgi:hypothetical protein